MASTEETFQQLVAELDFHPSRFLAGMAIHLVPEDASELAELFGGETGDHTGMVLEPFFAELEEREGQLKFHRARRIEPGHEA